MLRHSQRQSCQSLGVGSKLGCREMGWGLPREVESCGFPLSLRWEHQEKWGAEDLLRQGIRDRRGAWEPNLWAVPSEPALSCRLALPGPQLLQSPGRTQVGGPQSTSESGFPFSRCLHPFPDQRPGQPVWGPLWPDDILPPQPRALAQKPLPQKDDGRSKAPSHKGNTVS